MNATNAGGVRRRSVEIVAWPAATDLTLRLPHVHAMRLEEKGRGRSLKHAWTRSTADVVACMDVDLSTSRVDLVRTARDDLKGMGRILRSTLTGRARVPAVPRRTCAPQVPTARTPAPVTPVGVHATDRPEHLEYAS